MRYFFNIPTKSNSCNLNCGYCILKESDPNKDTTRQFTLDELKTFIKTHSTKDDDVLIGFGGSEPFTKENFPDTIKMLNFIKYNNYSVSLLSNGLFDYKILLNYKELFTTDNLNKSFGNYGRNRVGDFIITYHRHIIGSKSEQYYEEMVKWCVENKINIILQEIATPCNIDKTKIFLKRIQDTYNITTKIVALRAWGSNSFSNEFIEELYKGHKSGSCSTNYTDYKTIFNDHCSCFKGYDTYHILNTGYVIKCWYNQTVVGNIQANTLQKNKAIKIGFNIENNKLIRTYELEDNIDKDVFIEKELADIYFSENIL